MKRTGVHIGLSSLGRGSHELDFSPEPAELDLDSRFTDIDVHVRLSVTGTQVIVEMDARATVSLICDRTLDPFDIEIEGSSTILGTTEEVMENDRYDDVVPISVADQSIDISSAVRDTLMLAVPYRAIAPGAEDSEIRTTFSDNNSEAIDPRWEGLNEIRNKDD